MLPRKQTSSLPSGLITMATQLFVSKSASDSLELGVDGGSGTAGQCPNTGGAGTDGGKGGRGGDYAEAGTNGEAGANSGSGGAAGRAISREGTNASWTMTGSVNSTTLKGLYTLTRFIF